MRKSSVVLSDDEIAAQERNRAPMTDGKAAIEARVEAALEERRQARQAVQREYILQTGHVNGCGKIDPDFLKDIEKRRRERTKDQTDPGPVTAVYEAPMAWKPKSKRG